MGVVMTMVLMPTPMLLPRRSILLMLASVPLMLLLLLLLILVLMAIS